MLNLPILNLEQYFVFNLSIFVNGKKQRNQVLSTIAEVATKSGGEISCCDFGDIFTPEGRKATITNVITGVTKMFTDGLTSQPV